MLRFDVLIFYCNSCSTMLGKMFRTELDLELKLRRDGGPPFFYLRESIADIIHHHVKEPEVGLQEHIFSRAFPMHTLSNQKVVHVFL